MSQYIDMSMKCNDKQLDIVAGLFFHFPSPPTSLHYS